MLTFDEALARVLAAAPKLPAETVALDEALGRVLAEHVSAVTPLPAQDHSAMDGYAVRAASVTDAAAELPVRGESRTGHVAPPLEPGTTCRIFTGAALPPGADAVVMQENAVRTGDRVRFTVRPAPFEHVRLAGEDLTQGSTALEQGERLGAYHLGLAAAVDRARLVVVRRPRVTILATGDELRAPGSPARPASIPESNSVVLAALARGAGATARVHEPAGDDLEETRGRIARALEDSDLLVTIAGVSVGEHDVVRPALEASGVRLEFHKVAIKPGKPLTLGRRGDTVVLGVPGNPVSAQVTFALFGVPLLRRMQGDARAVPPPRRVRLAARLRQSGGRRGFYASVVQGDLATPLATSSGSTVSLARANALLIVPEDCAGYEAGEEAWALMLVDL